MELNIAEMRKKATEQEVERAEEVRERLKRVREQGSKKNEKLNALFKRVGEKAAEETRVAMEEQVDTAIKHAEAEIKAEYAQKYGAVECDDQRESLKKMLRRLMG